MKDRPNRPIRYPGERSRWLVPSSDGNEPYLVDMDDEEVGFWCACPDWHFRQKDLGPHYKCKHILAVEILMICQRCEGCGKIANDEDGTPWTQWENLPVKNAVAVIVGIIKPIPCPQCGGTGRT